MKSVLGGSIQKKVGFKLMPKDLEEGGAPQPDEEKKIDDTATTNALQVSSSLAVSTDLPAATVPSPNLASPASGEVKQASTPSTTCSPTLSSTSPSPRNPSSAINQSNVSISNTSSSNNKDHGSLKSKGRKKFRLPFSFRGKRRSSADSCNQSGDNSDEELVQAGEHEDPVMEFYQARYKNRVRWSLDIEGKGDKEGKASSPREPLLKHAQSDDSREGKGSADSALEGESPRSIGGRKNSSSVNNNHNNIMKFVTGALFGGSHKGNSDKEFHQEVAKEVASEKDLVWESNDVSADGGEILYTSQQRKMQSSHQPQQLTISFTEDPKVRLAVLKLTKKGRKAQSTYYRYDYAVKYFVRAMDMLTEAKYPEQHPMVQKTFESLNEAHHKLSSFNNSANIVKIGIKYEDSGELARALKMYSIAYRIRRDNLSRSHPSLVVLLNMLGSIQTKRGEYEEAMKIYELALKGTPRDPSSSEYLETINLSPTPSTTVQDNSAAAVSTASSQDDDSAPPPPPPPLPPQSEDEPYSAKGNLLAKSVTYREMGTIFEKWDRREEALKMYHLSLDCVAEWKAAAGVLSSEKGLELLELNDTLGSINTSVDASVGPTASTLVNNVHVKKSYNEEAKDDATVEKGEMEALVGLTIPDMENEDQNAFVGSISYYDSFFPPHLEAVNAQKGRASASALASGDAEGLDRRDDYADIDVALTIHQIAQLFRKQGQFSQALEAYAVALRGMKYCLGNNHPNVAAILGNFGNLQKEMGDFDAAYDTYQEVLGIESYRLGLSHPDVAITLHNIATIDAARGNHERALKLYGQVMRLQEKLFGEGHISIAVTSACMGDVYEALGQMKDAFEAYEDSLRIKSSFQGHHSLEVARILHKLAKVALKRGDHRLASSYISRTIFVYRLNGIADDHEWVVDAHRDSADIDASLAMTKGMTFEC